MAEREEAPDEVLRQALEGIGVQLVTEEELGQLLAEMERLGIPDHPENN